MMAKKGDKFIVEISDVIKTKNGCLYRMKPFNTLVFDEYGLEQLDPLEWDRGDMVTNAFHTGFVAAKMGAKENEAYKYCINFMLEGMAIDEYIYGTNGATD